LALGITICIFNSSNLTLYFNLLLFILILLILIVSSNLIIIIIIIIIILPNVKKIVKN